MMDDLEQMIKQRLLEDLVDRMSDSSGDRLKPKGLGVEVQAPDSKHLAEGLDKAKEVLGGKKGSDEDRMAAMAKGDCSDDDLLGLLDDEDDEDKE